MKDGQYERGDRVYDARAERRGVVTSVHPPGSLIGSAVAIEPDRDQLGGHWFSAPEFLRLIESVEIPMIGGAG